MDKIDKMLLNLIQNNATLTTSELADIVGLSASPCARRIKRLEQSGVISGYQAVLSRGKIGISMTVFVEVSLKSHQASSIDDFESEITQIEEIISCHVVSGAYDYLLEVVTNDLQGYEAFMRKIQRLNNVKDIHSHLAIRQVKGNGSLPIY